MSGIIEVLCKGFCYLCWLYAGYLRFGLIGYTSVTLFLCAAETAFYYHRVFSQNKHKENMKRYEKRGTLNKELNDN